MVKALDFLSSKLKTLYFQNRQRSRKINPRLFRKILLAALENLGVERFELGIHIVGAAEMTWLNETFLRHKGSTDVITFDYNVGDDVRGLSKKTRKKLESPHVVSYGLHGEIFLCIDEAIAQAKRFRTSWQAELARYAVHGVLHLLGHDDTRAATRRKMKREEDRVLRELAAQLDLKKIGSEK